MKEITAIFCGNPKDHKCDDNGPEVYGLTDGGTTTDREEATRKGHTWGSVTCSICGRTAMENSLWEDYE